MPRYDFKCGECDKVFEVSLSIKEKESTKILCPECQSENTLQIFNVMDINTKSSSTSSAPACGANCDSCMYR